MRHKIEERMVAAIKSEKPFSESNTGVSPVWAGDSVVLGVKVFLHGNCIAQITPSEKRIDLHTCGWDTATTTSRMNAILAGLTDGAFYVTCRTYDKAIGKECRLVQRGTSDWNVNLVRGTTVPTIHTLYDLARFGLEGYVDRHTFIYANPVWPYYHNVVIAQVDEKTKTIYVSIVNSSTHELHPHPRGAVERINVLLRAKTREDVTISIKNGVPILIGKPTKWKVSILV
jgi:hypothetical protein